MDKWKPVISQENTSKRYFDIHTTEEISKEQVEEKLSEFEKIGWTDNFHTFIEFVNYATQVNEQVKSLYEFFAVHLSDEGQSYFNKIIKGFKLSYDKTPQKSDYLKYHLEHYYKEPQTLRKRNNPFKRLENRGYIHGLNQIDFCIYDFIRPVGNYKPSLTWLGFEYYDLEQGKSNRILNGKTAEFPITIEYFLNEFSPFFSNFMAIARGYSKFLMASEIQKMMNDLKNNKITETENLKKPETENIQKKLKWEGQKNQLYDVIRQLKKKQLIANSYTEIATFICQNLEGFETNFPTVLKEIQKDERPAKNKRIDLDLSELPETDTE